MFLYINFAIRNRDIGGYIAMIMDMPSLSRPSLAAARIHRANGRRFGPLR